jgi:hypothetical protein
MIVGDVTARRRAWEDPMSRRTCKKSRGFKKSKNSCGKTPLLRLIGNVSWRKRNREDSGG